MNSLATGKCDSPISILKRYSRPQAADHFCELCHAAIPGVHRHLLEVSSRKAVCACEPCALRFEGVISGRFKLIPRDLRLLPDFKMSDVDWESLSLPIDLAFFYRASPDLSVRALYPSPAGATESLLGLETWANLEAENHGLRELAPDVEALLVNRIGGGREHYVAPIDVCYELVGLIRAHWRGLAGGEVVWKQIERFFIGLKEQTRKESLCPI